MDKKILKILSKVINEIQKNTVDEIDIKLLVDTLAEKGFSEEEIAAAISWIEVQDESYDEEFFDRLPRPLWRQLNEIEKDAISPHAFSYLFHLRELDVLRDDEMEAIIDRAVKLEIPQLDVDVMQDLIAIVVLDFENTASNGYFQFTSNNIPH